MKSRISWFVASSYSIHDAVFKNIVKRMENVKLNSNYV
jgi:hypothetical protein